MMYSDILRGELVRLTAEDPEVLAEAFTRWGGDSEYLRMLDSEPANRFSARKLTEWIRKDQESLSSQRYAPYYQFGIRTLDGDKLVGMVDLDGDAYPHGDIFVGIGVGERDFWGRGYGTDAMKVILRYAFQELNLRRVSLNTFEYNPRAIRSYEKAGFVYEGKARSFLLREGVRWDLIFMGILREEWLAGSG